MTDDTALISGAEAALAANEDKMQLDMSGENESTRLRHLLYSLLPWCDTYAVSFDDILEDVRAEWSAAREREGGGGG